MAHISSVSELPWNNGRTIRGRLPSPFTKPDGSFMSGIPAEAKAALTTSLSDWCLTMRPVASLHVKPCKPRAANVRLAKINTQTNADGYANRLVI